MNGSTIQKLPTIEEGAFYQLLESAGMVQIDIAKIERYFVPFVSFFEKNATHPVSCGAIVRGGKDVLAAESMHGLLGLLDDLAGGCTSVRINLAIEH